MVVKKSDGSERQINDNFSLRWAFGNVDLVQIGRDCNIIQNDKFINDVKEAIREYEKEKARKTIFNSELTNRGFGTLHFKDTSDKECRIQKSSIATEDRLWLFGDAHINQDMAEQIAIVLFYFSKYGELPRYLFPEED